MRRGRPEQEDLGELEYIEGPRVVVEIDLPQRGSAAAAAAEAALAEEAGQLRWAARLASRSAGPRALAFAAVVLSGESAGLVPEAPAAGGGAGPWLGVCVTDQPGPGPGAAARAGRSWLRWPEHPNVLPLVARGANLFVAPYVEAVGGDAVAAALREARLPPRQVRRVRSRGLRLSRPPSVAAPAPAPALLLPTRCTGANACYIHSPPMFATPGRQGGRAS